MALTIGNELNEFVAKRTNGKVAFHSAYFIDYADLRRDISCTLMALDNPRKRSQITFPSRVEETNLFPSEKMLVYMNVEKPFTKKAKPRDWIKILNEHLEQNFAEYLV